MVAEVDGVCSGWRLMGRPAGGGAGFAWRAGGGTESPSREAQGWFGWDPRFALLAEAVGAWAPAPLQTAKGTLWGCRWLAGRMAGLAIRCLGNPGLIRVLGSGLRGLTTRRLHPGR